VAGLGRYGLGPLALGLGALAIPLALIALSAYLDPSFDPYSNALSDLGNSLTSEVAPIFNLGLSLGGFLLGLYAASYAVKVDRALACLLAVTAFSLTLVAVFDEAYDRFHRLHFIVSLIFFASLLAFLLGFALAKRTLTPLISIAAGSSAWTLHLAYGIPKGAAVPEIVSIAAAAPFYLYMILKSATTVKEASSPAP